MSLEVEKPIYVAFAPADDITMAELIEILKRTVFQYPASARHAYSRMPPELQRHFRKVKVP